MEWKAKSSDGSTEKASLAKRAPTRCYATRRLLGHGSGAVRCCFKGQMGTSRDVYHTMNDAVMNEAARLHKLRYQCMHDRDVELMKARASIDGLGKAAVAARARGIMREDR